MLRLEDIMDTKFPSIDCDHSVAEVEELLTNSQCTGAPVLNPDGSAFGVITLGDLLRFRRNADNNAMGTRAWEVCTTRPLSVGADETVASVASMIVNEGVNHIVVLNAAGAVIGMLTSEKLVEAYLQAETGGTAGTPSDAEESTHASHVSARPDN